jgi:hypothetical protein
LFDWHVPDDIRVNIEHSPGLRTPSKHVVGVQSVTLETTFVHDPPEGSEAEQSPTVSALGSNSDASQFAKRSNVGKYTNYQLGNKEITQHNTHKQHLRTTLG